MWTADMGCSMAARPIFHSLTAAVHGSTDSIVTIRTGKAEFKNALMHGMQALACNEKTMDDWKRRLLLGLLGAVLGSSLFSIRYALRIQYATDNVVAHTGKIANATTANKNNGVFLQIVAFTTDVSRHFDAVGEANTSHLAERRVRLLGRHRFDLQTHTALRGVALHGRVLRLAPLHTARLLDELVNRRHIYSFRFASSWDRMGCYRVSLPRQVCFVK